MFSPCRCRRALTRCTPLATRSFSSHTSVLKYAVVRRKILAQPVSSSDKTESSKSSGLDLALPATLKPQQKIELKSKQPIISSDEAVPRQQRPEQQQQKSQKFLIFDTSHLSKFEKVGFMRRNAVYLITDIYDELRALSSRPDTAQWLALAKFCRWLVDEFYPFSKYSTASDCDLVFAAIMQLAKQPVDSKNTAYRDSGFWQHIFQAYFTTLDKLDNRLESRIPSEVAIFSILGAYQHNSFSWLPWYSDVLLALVRVCAKHDVCLELSLKIKLFSIVVQIILTKQRDKEYVEKYVYPIVDAFESKLVNQAQSWLVAQKLSVDERTALASNIAIFYNGLLSYMPEEVLPLEQRMQYIEHKVNEAAKMGSTWIDAWVITIREVFVQLSALGQHEKMRQLFARVKTIFFDPSLCGQMIASMYWKSFDECIEYYTSLPVDVQQNGIVLRPYLAQSFMTKDTSLRGFQKLCCMLRECESKGSYQWPTPLAATTQQLEQFKIGIKAFKDMTMFDQSKRVGPVLAAEGMTHDEFVDGLDRLLAAEIHRKDVVRRETSTRTKM